MCGICGTYNFDGIAADKRLLKGMCDLMLHRGPDSEGFYAGGPAGLGMRRLSIIDLATGDQPVFSENGNLAIVLNGEVYNYIELRALLAAKGHNFKTTSDTEVVVHLYEEFGEAALPMLNGFFAFAIYDAQTGEMRVVRDRWGIKPLYYFNDGKRLSFASEIKAFGALGTRFELDKGAVWDYFSYGYLPAENTMLEGVSLLPPGCFLKISRAGAVSVERYCQLERSPEYGGLSLDEAREIYFGKVENAVKLSLRSDVPVGLFLSGGLDSNIVLHEARKFMPGKISTYTVGFDSGHFDEAGLVRRLAAELGLNASFLTVDPGWVKDNFKRLAGFHDSLAITPAFLALARLSETAAKDLKVVLSGTGGDELLMGYPTYQADILWRYFSRLPRFIKKAMASAAGILPHPPGRISLGYKFKKFSEGLFYHFEKAHYSWRSIFNESEKDGLLSPGMFPGARHDSSRAYEKAFDEAPPGWDRLERASFADMKVWLVNMGHIQSDTFTMCSSLELRPPLLENDLAEFLFSLPLGLKMKGFSTKSFFRYCYKDKLPAYITSQAKMGFHLPMADWLRGDLKSWASDYLFSRSDSGRYFRREALEDIFSSHQRGSVDNSFKIFSIICFLEWVDQHRGLVNV
jgi:asparagine synthase (glutamine-hydrolysing)